MKAIMKNVCVRRRVGEDGGGGDGGREDGGREDVGRVGEDDGNGR